MALPWRCAPFRYRWIRARIVERAGAACLVHQLYESRRAHDPGPDGEHPLKVIGICDTPSELFLRISEVLREPREEVRLEYAGLNHLGWVSRVSVGGRDVMERLLADEESLRQLYPADLFDPLLIQTLRLIPSEYLFFYYGQRKAYENQLRAGASRGEELAQLNTELYCRSPPKIRGKDLKPTRTTSCGEMLLI